MFVRKQPFFRVLCVLGGTTVALTVAPDLSGAAASAISRTKPEILWRNPDNLASRNLFYGPGGRQHEPPSGTFTFLKEELKGANPKFVVRDPNGVKWKVKLGIEARPETVASRIVWAAGYFADQDYFVSRLRVKGLPSHLHRGNKFIIPEGIVVNARLKREAAGEEKAGTWSWRHDPFTGSRELDGLRTVMGLINNWDLKDDNNKIYDTGTELIFLVSDLGASFGNSGRSWPFAKERGNLESYRRAPLFGKVTAQYVDFRTPGRPQLWFLVNPFEYVSHVHLEWVGRRIPRDHARWMGRLLSRLSQRQIQDAFRAAGYSTPEINAFSQVLENRIAQLSDL